MDKQKFPKFIQNGPHGKDKYEGHSADRLAKAIENHIESINDCKDDTNKLPPIIGLDGEWGSGKSNVIKILKNNIREKYYLFEYDAWGHQEDLQRRSFLETLTDDLIFAENGKLLPEKCSKEIKDAELETWKEKLKNLLARKRDTITTTRPKISSGITGAVLLILLTTVFSTITPTIIENTNLSLCTQILIPFIPLIIMLIIWVIWSLYKGKIIWSELFEIYSDDKIKNIVNETISEREPSVREFCDWMTDLSNDLLKDLIIVFDNMDRLPAEKVKQLWSSIHTFFAESRYPKIWVIITFDREHLANAFGNEPQTNAVLTNHFINKTFPVIYKVSPPIMTDWKKLFNEYFEEAFGETENQYKDTIQTLFGIIKPHFTPRDIIAFINELVSLKQTWKDQEISLSTIAIFSLKNEEILKSPVESILSGNYLKSVEKIINNSEELQGCISALTYGTDVKFAEQIPLKQYLQKALNGETRYDINKYSDRNHFVSFLDDEIKALDPAMLDKAIICLSELDPIKGIIVTKQWNDLVELHLLQQIVKLSLEATHEKLLLNADDENKKIFSKYLCDKFREFKEFKGDLFFLAMQELDNYIKEHELKILVDDYIVAKEVTPEVFIDYVNQAKDNYENYKLTCDNKALNDYLVSLIPEKLPSMDFIEFLFKDELYPFDVLKSRIESAITNNEINVNCFPQIMKTYKAISKEAPLKQQFNQNQIQTLLTSTTDKTSAAYYDLVAMGLTQSIDTAHVGDLDEKVAERIECYRNYGDLLLLSVTWNSDLLFKVDKKLTEKSYAVSKMDILQVLPLFGKIKNTIGVSGVDFLNRLNGWSKPAEDKINVDNISTMITDFKFYDDSSKTNNKLTKHINNIAIKKLGSMPVEELFAQRNTPTDYWLNCAYLLIQGTILKTLPDNLTEFCKRVLSDIAAGTQQIPTANSVLDVIINKGDKKKLQPTIKNICHDYCNKIKTITPPLFIFFATKFDFVNKMDSREGDITLNILNAVIKDPNCLNLILENSVGYIKIIKNAGDDAEDLKGNIRQLLQSNKSDNLQKLAIAIGIKDEKEI